MFSESDRRGIYSKLQLSAVQIVVKANDKSAPIYVLHLPEKCCKYYTYSMALTSSQFGLSNVNVIFSQPQPEGSIFVIQNKVGR